VLADLQLRREFVVHPFLFILLFVLVLKTIRIIKIQELLVIFF